MVVKGSKLRKGHKKVLTTVLTLTLLVAFLLSIAPIGFGIYIDELENTEDQVQYDSAPNNAYEGTTAPDTDSADDVAPYADLEEEGYEDTDEPDDSDYNNNIGEEVSEVEEGSEPEDYTAEDYTAEEYTAEEYTDETYKSASYKLDLVPAITHSITFEFPYDDISECGDFTIVFIEAGSDYDLLENVYARTETGAEVFAYISDWDNFYINAEWPDNVFTVTYTAIHPESGDAFTQEREVIVIVPIMESGIVLHSGTFSGAGGADWRFYDNGTLHIEAGVITERIQDLPIITSIYNIYFCTNNGPIFLTPNATGIFAILPNLTGGNFQALNTTGVTNMYRMFEDSSALTSLN